MIAGLSVDDIFVKSKQKDAVMEMVISSYNMANMYRYEPRAFYVNRKGEKIIVNEPDSYREMEYASEDAQASVYKEKMKTDPQFGFYIEAKNRRDSDNASDELHLKRCIHYCKKLGDGFIKYKDVFENVLNSYANRKNYYWEK